LLLIFRNIAGIGDFFSTISRHRSYSIPEAICLLVLQTATEFLCRYCSDRWKAAVTINSIQGAVYDSLIGLDFIIAKNVQRRMVAGVPIALMSFWHCFREKN
jgi:hypothetical protein